MVNASVDIGVDRNESRKNAAFVLVDIILVNSSDGEDVVKMKIEVLKCVVSVLLCVFFQSTNS